MSKLICVVGATGHQGGSVARCFLQAGYRVRGLTRHPDSPAAQALAAAGAEMVAADLDEPATLTAAFQGANAIFSVTNYWEPFFRPDCRAQATAPGGPGVRRFAYDVERRQGQNIADAAAAVADGLDANGFFASTLSHAGRCSGGRLTELYHFDAKADVFPDYVNAHHPALAAKMSCIHTGFFYTSFQILPDSYFGRLPDGTVEMAFPTSPTKLVPHLDPVGDLGSFVYAVAQMPPGRAYMAAGSTCTWPDWIAAWGRVVGVPVSYREVTPAAMIAATPDPYMGPEVTDMFAYSSDPGYDGGMALLTAEDLKKAGIDCPMTTFEEWAKKQDWSAYVKKA